MKKKAVALGFIFTVLSILVLTVFYWFRPHAEISAILSRSQTRSRPVSSATMQVFPIPREWAEIELAEFSISLPVSMQPIESKGFTAFGDDSLTMVVDTFTVREFADMLQAASSQTGTSYSRLPALRRDCLIAQIPSSVWLLGRSEACALRHKMDLATMFGVSHINRIEYFKGPNNEGTLETEDTGQRSYHWQLVDSEWAGSLVFVKGTNAVEADDLVIRTICQSIRRKNR